MKIKLFNMQELQFGLSGIAGNLLVNLPYGKHAYYGREAATRNVSKSTDLWMNKILKLLLMM